MATGPLFLQRKSYRARRMMDVVRLLPLMGLVLWMVPLIWPHADRAALDGAQAMPTSVALQYLFGVWIVLVVLGWLLWRRTAQGINAAEADVEDLPD